MRHSLSGPLLVGALLFTAACSDDPEAGDAATPPVTSTETPSPSRASGPVDEAGGVTTPLEGTWVADVSRNAYVAAIEDLGYPKAVATQMLQELPGPEFRLEFLGDRFSLAYAPTGEGWQSGTFTLEGGRIVLDDEAPVELVSFAVEIEGDTVVFTDGGATDAGEMAAGVPDYLPLIGFWSADDWSRQ